MKKGKYWLVQASKDNPGVGEILIYGDIVGAKLHDSDVTAADFQRQLASLGDIKKLDIYINSAGGNVFEGQAIYSILRRHPAVKNVYIDGLAASIASVIAMAGDTVSMPKNAMMMVHHPFASVIGNASDMRKMAEDLDKVSQTIISAYMAKVSISEEELKKLLDAETWMTADEALSYGFADEVTEALSQIAARADEQILANYKHMPEQAKSLFAQPLAGVVPSDVSRETAPEDEAWEAPTLADFTSLNWGDLTDAERKKIAGHFAWAAEMPPETYGSLKLPHHRPSDGRVVWAGVAAAAAYLSRTDIPEGDVQAVQAHLASHYRQFDKPAPWEDKEEDRLAEIAELRLARQELEHVLSTLKI